MPRDSSKMWNVKYEKEKALFHMALFPIHFTNTQKYEYENELRNKKRIVIQQLLARGQIVFYSNAYIL